MGDVTVKVGTPPVSFPRCRTRVGWTHRFGAASDPGNMGCRLIHHRPPLTF